MKEKDEKLCNESGTKISLLVNSLYFSIECVFVILGEKWYRLIAIHQGQLIVDRSYKSFKGAKVSFARYFRIKHWQKELKPQWTQFYPPDEDWLEEKWHIIQVSRECRNQNQ